jgi:membrane protease YdiL (CAAX protease family)
LSNSLLTGPPRYVARGPWPPLLAVVAAVVIQAGLQLAGGVVGTLASAAFAGVSPDRLSGQQLLVGLLTFLLLSQVFIIGVTWWAAGLFGGNRREVLQADRGAPTVGEVVTAVAGLTLVLGIFNALVYLLRPDLFLADMQQFLPMIQGPFWPLTALGIGLGAPLSEELLFRGFVLSALAQWRFGFWPAALLMNAVWTTFHLGYSVVGLLEVFIGGAYMSWLLWRSGSIWLPIICHAATNCFFLVILALYSFR